VLQHCLLGMTAHNVSRHEQIFRRSASQVPSYVCKAGKARVNIATGAGVVMVSKGASLRKLGIGHLPPKVPPNSHLGQGAISSQYTAGLRQGEYMIRLDALVLHTSLVAKEAALRMARDALSGNTRRVQFVITEQVCAEHSLWCAEGVASSAHVIAEHSRDAHSG
jgi:hypothetical protein